VLDKAVSFVVGLPRQIREEPLLIFPLAMFLAIIVLAVFAFLATVCPDEPP